MSDAAAPTKGSDNPGPRVLFIGRGHGQLSYYASVLAALIDRGAEVEWLVDPDRDPNGRPKDAALKAFLAIRPSLKSGWAPRRADQYRERLFALREIRNYRSYLVRDHTTPHYVERGRNYLVKGTTSQFDDPAARADLMRPETDEKLRAEEAATPPDAMILAMLKARAPDVLLASPANMRFSEQTDYIKAAKALGIPTGICVLTWDNLSTKGLIQIQPDQLYVWNDDQRRDAIEIHGADPARILVAGAPFFDKWFDKSADPLSRADFFARAGLDPARPVLLYLGSSAKIAPDETWFVDALAEAIKTSDDAAVRAHQLLLRPHPSNATILGEMVRPGLTVWPKTGGFPETSDKFDDLRASCAFATAAIGINTSGMIDAVLAGRPTFSVTLPQYVDTQGDALHFRYLADSGALYLADDIAAFLDQFSTLLRGEDSKVAEREHFARTFARPQGLDRSAGEVIAEAVFKLAGRGIAPVPAKRHGLIAKLGAALPRLGQRA